jgi:hypothetical protein
MKKILASLTRLLNTALELLAALLGTYYSARYALLSRRLARPDVLRDSKRGFVIIQIDGLSYDHLCAAVEQGYAPHLRRLLERKEMVLYPWKPGIPGTTPATQAGIMFGNSDPIPAFRWYDKQLGQAMVSSQPGVAQAIQAELEQRAPGILRGGSSYMNMFDGGASLALYTLGTFGKSRFFEGLRGLGFLTLFALNPFRSGTVLALAIWEYLTDLAQRAEATVRRTNPRPLSRAFPFLRVMSSVVLRDIQTFSVTLDLFRGVPAIYTTFFGFDELAHNYGPLSKPALRALRAIDSRIRRLDRFRRMNLSRPYDLFLLSDHGMTEDIPFSNEYGQTLGDLVQDLVGRSAAIREFYSSQQPELSSALFVQQELEAIEASFRPPLSRIPHYLANYVERRLPKEMTDQDYEPAQPSDVVVSSSGSLSHIYLNARPDQMELSQIAALYPTLVSSLLSHPGIWLVIGRDAANTVILSKEGSLTIGGGGAGGVAHVEGQNPLSRLAYGDWAQRQLARLASLNKSGDLILIGAYDPDNQRVSCFESQWACHGGLGGPQDLAMLMTEPHIDWPLASVERAASIYSLFTRQYDIS